MFPISVSTYALIDCCVANFVALFDAMLSSSLIPVTVAPSPAMLSDVAATNAPVTSRQLGRISRRASLGLARAGGIADHSSGDFIIAFSNSEKAKNLDDSELTPLMRGVIESTEEAVINSVLKSDTMTGRDGNTRIGIPIDQVTSILAKYNVI